MKILVAIANHGTKNRGYLDQLLAEYRSMPWDVSIKVLSNVPKPDLGDDVEVLVGTPSDDPWSLPFAHRSLFVDAQDDFDMFIYTEDDTLLTERNLQAWMEVQADLPDEEIAGFLRFETYRDGSLSYCGVHYHYHWDPKQTKARKGQTYSHFTNEHSALCVLTQKQLKHCIASGGYSIEPHQGRYDMLVSAASDPYTQCGLQRLICISRLSDFLLCHLPNVYLGRIGVRAEDFLPQIDVLHQIAGGALPPEELFDPKVRLEVPREAWNKDYYPKPEAKYADVIDFENRAILSVGAGAGELELDWKARGARVTCLPIDAIIGATASRKGLRTLVPDVAESLKELDGETFDWIVFHHVLEHMADPPAVLRQLQSVLAAEGQFVVFCGHQPGRKTRFKVRKELHPLHPDTPFAESNYHYTDPKVVRAWMQAAGLNPLACRYILRDKAARVARLGLGLFDAKLADAFIQTGRRA